MFLNDKQKITANQLIEIIEQAKDAELCRDLKKSESLFKPFWNDIDDEPDFPSEAEPMIKAELLRLTGFFLSYYGRAKNKHYQERAKNYLTRAIELFEQIQLSHKAAEAKVMLAMCYWYNGASSESKLILDETEYEYENNKLHPVYLQICMNRLIIFYIEENFADAFKLLKKLEVPMELCSDYRLQTMYHNQAGILYRNTSKTDKALFHFQNAIQFARAAKSLSFEGANFNNLANLCKDIGKFDDALAYILQAQSIFEEIKEEGWLAHVLDTKASILFHQNKIAAALSTLSEAIRIFRQGEDYGGITEALFLRVRIYLTQEENSKAFLDFAELISIANEKTGELSLQKYSAEFSKLMYARKHLDYASEIRAYRKFLIVEALTKANHQVVKAAEMLGITHQSLSESLNNQFPEIHKELGIARRSKRRAKPPSSKKSEQPKLRSISRLNIKIEDIYFEENDALIEPGKMNCFVMDGERLPKLKTGVDIIVLCHESPQTDFPFVIAQNRFTKEIVCATNEYDALTYTHFLSESVTHLAAPLNDFTIFGQIIGYCLLDEATGEKINFLPLPND